MQSSFYVQLAMPVLIKDQVSSWCFLLRLSLMNSAARPMAYARDIGAGKQSWNRQS